MKKILVTGGSGFFGTRFYNYYKNEYDIVLTNSKDMDVTNFKAVMDKILGFKPDIVIHAGAVASTEFCEENPEIAYKINVEGSINVAKACKAVDAEMIFISTEQVFNGNIEAGPYFESSLPVPNTNYGKTKLEAEFEIQKNHDKIWILRFTWLFGLPEIGCGMSPNILWDTVKAIAKGNQITASNREFRGLTYSRTLIEQFNKVFELPYGLYHMGSENSMSRYDAVKLILNELGISDSCLLLDEEKYKDSPRDVRLSTEKIQEKGFIFGKSEDEIKKCLDDFHFRF